MRTDHAVWAKLRSAHSDFSAKDKRPASHKAIAGRFTCGQLGRHPPYP